MVYCRGRRHLHLKGVVSHDGAGCFLVFLFSAVGLGRRWRERRRAGWTVEYTTNHAVSSPVSLGSMRATSWFLAASDMDMKGQKLEETDSDRVITRTYHAMR